MDREALERCRRYHRDRQRRRREQTEALRRQVLDNITAVGDVLRGMGATKVLLYGSVLNPNRFSSHSDIDILVYGLPWDAWSSAVRAVEALDGLPPLAIDLKRAEELPSSFVAFVEEQGTRV